MKLKSLFLMALIASNLSHAGASTLGKIKSLYPDDYAYTSESCSQWAEDDQLTGQEKETFIQNCILEELGYLIEDDNESSSEVDYD